MNTPFVKAGCDCEGCVAYGEHEEGFVGWHYITLEHLHGRFTSGEWATCRCGWGMLGESVGAAIAAHRAEAYGLVLP